MFNLGYEQFASTTQFYLYGRSRCTRTGWESHSRSYEKPDILDSNLDLSNKVYMVTGANNGIGKEITSYLAKQRGTVFMICRSEAKSIEVKNNIIKESDNPNVFVLVCDCSLESNVRNMWKEFMNHPVHNSKPHLECLVCNAGALSNEKTLTSEGVETTFAAHLQFGVYLLGSLAIPLLNKTPIQGEGRIIIVSSGGAYNTAFPSWEAATSTGNQKYDGQFAYAYAKRGQILLAERWSKKYPNLKVVSCHPGWTATDGVDAAYGSNKSMLEPLRTLWQGAEGIIWLCVAPTNKIEGGAFYLDRSPRRKHIAGPFFSEGTFTKNSDEDVDLMMLNLQRWCNSMWRPTPQTTAAKLAACSKDLTASTCPLDISSFMGQWLVLANIPTSLEVGTTDNYENYELEQNTNVVKIRFQYNPKDSKEPSNAYMRATIENVPINTYWTLSPKLLGIHWPIGLQYLLLDRGFAGENLEYCIVGVPKRTYLWIMTRRRPKSKASMNEHDFGEDEEKMENVNIIAFNNQPVLTGAEEKKIMKMAIDFCENLGYDCSKLRLAAWSKFRGY